MSFPAQSTKGRRACNLKVAFLVIMGFVLARCTQSTLHLGVLGFLAAEIRNQIYREVLIRVVTKQYLNGLFGSFDYFGPNKQTEFLQSVKQTISCVCLLV